MHQHTQNNKLYAQCKRHKSQLRTYDEWLMDKMCHKCFKHLEILSNKEELSHKEKLQKVNFQKINRVIVNLIKSFTCTKQRKRAVRQKKKKKKKKKDKEFYINRGSKYLPPKSAKEYYLKVCGLKLE